MAEWFNCLLERVGGRQNRRSIFPLWRKSRQRFGRLVKSSGKAAAAAIRLVATSFVKVTGHVYIFQCNCARARVRTRSAVPSLWFCLINGLLVDCRPPLSALLTLLPTCSRPLAATNSGGGPAAISPRGLRNFGKLRSNSRLRPLSTQKRRGRSNGWPEEQKRTSGFYERTVISDSRWRLFYRDRL